MSGREHCRVAASKGGGAGAERGGNKRKVALQIRVVGSVPWPTVGQGKLKRKTVAIDGLGRCLGCEATGAGHCGGHRREHRVEDASVRMPHRALDRDHRAGHTGLKHIAAAQ